MAAFDTQVQNLTFPATRSANNNALLSLTTWFSSNVAPTATYPYMPWTDTSFNPPIIKQRNGANSTWIPVAKADTTNWGFVQSDNAALTNIPTAPTAPPGTNTIQIATCAYVRSEIAAHDGWITPTMLNGWSAAVQIRYRRKRDGSIELQGLAIKTTPTVNESIIQLPAGYRPSQLVHWPSGNDAVNSSVFIETSGDVRFYAPPSISLAGQFISAIFNFSFPTV